MSLNIVLDRVYSIYSGARRLSISYYQYKNWVDVYLAVKFPKPVVKMSNSITFPATSSKEVDITILLLPPQQPTKIEEEGERGHLRSTGKPSLPPRGTFHIMEDQYALKPALWQTSLFVCKMSN